MDATLSNIPVMCLVSPSGVPGSKGTFDKLEAKLPSLKKRKFYGVLDGTPEHGTYRACVGILDGDNPTALGLETWTIPGGKYARAKIADWEKNLDKIGPAFDELLKQYTLDPTRPTIEFYRSQEELFLFLPVT